MKSITGVEGASDIKDARRLFTCVTSEALSLDVSDQGLQVWSDMAPAVKTDPGRLFAKCVIVSACDPKHIICKQIEPLDATGATFTVLRKSAWHLNCDTDCATIDDVGMLPHYNIPCVLDFCKERFLKNIIYSTADPLLLAINPFKDLKNTTPQWISKYKEISDVSKLPPHVFSVARKALDDLHSLDKNQCIIVSGESGAGKTEATKQIMRFLATSDSASGDSQTQKAVLAANPVLEAFGNAKTVRNNNSSRFGRFMQLQIARGGGIEYGAVQSFLLEKSRIVTQSNDDRNYHIFYQILKGASAEMREKHCLKAINEYNFLNPNSIDCAQIDDVEDFKQVNEALLAMGLSEEEKETVFSIVSGVLLLGNAKISTGLRFGVEDAAIIDPATQQIWQEACNLLHLDFKQVETSLFIKKTFAGSQVVEGVWKQEECNMLKVSLSKAVYDRLFGWLIEKLNRSIHPPTSFSHYMAMLDIFGFEIFAENSLEQLFINIANERLQKNFIDVVFSRENKLYNEEGITQVTMEWTDNEATIAVLCDRKKSVLATLEDQCLAPSGSDRKMVTNLHVALAGNPNFKKSQISPADFFVVVHTVGEITYCSKNFILKNKDVLRPELAELVQNSENKIMQELFAGVSLERGKLGKGQLIDSQFTTQLEDLMDLINTTEPHFVRCVKPNDSKQPLGWVPFKVLLQLHSLSILEALQLKELGYSYRRPFDEFVHQFRYVNIELSESKIDPCTKCLRLLRECDIPQNDYKIGKTMMFMKPSAPKVMQEKQRKVLADWSPAVKILEACYLRNKYRKTVLSKENGLKITQNHFSRFHILQQISSQIAQGKKMPTNFELDASALRALGA